MNLHHSVVTFGQGFEAFGCVVLDQDEVTCLDWRFTSLLVVMFLDIAFPTVQKLLCYHLIDVFQCFLIRKSVIIVKIASSCMQ